MADKNCSMCGGKGYYCEFSTLETCWCVEPATKADEASDLRTEVAKLKRLIAERWKPEVERLRKDAERYRFLCGKERGCVVVRDRTSHLFGESLDAAIDAALEGDGR